MSTTPGRNSPCPCGSGKKYKKCCQLRIEAAATSHSTEYSHIVDLKRLGQPLKADGRPQISTIHNGKRIRAVGSRLYARPLSETFHEFILTLLAPIFGGKWYDAEFLKPLEERHIVAQWYYHFRVWQKNNCTGEKIAGAWRAVTDGPSQAIMQLAYDVYLLEHCLSLPKSVIRRLRDREAFQGVRYEIAVAAIFARLGYKIDWEDEKQSVRHCEFIASNPRTGDSIGVEAKSRRRSGVLHEPIKYEGPLKLRGDIGALLQKALTQKPDGKPFIVFVDLNLPATANTEFPEKPWFSDVQKLIGEMPPPTPERPDVANAIVITNFSSHYGAPGGQAPPREYVTIISRIPQNPTRNATALTELVGVIADYGQIRDQERDR